MSKRAEKQAELRSRPPRTLGQMKIRVLIARNGIQHVARDCGVTVSRVSAWANGFEQPEGGDVHETLHLFGIERGDWGRVSEIRFL